MVLRNARPHLFVRLLLLLLVGTQAGCVVTRPMWDAAKATEVEAPLLLVCNQGDPAPRFQAIYFVAISEGRSPDAYLYDVVPVSASAWTEATSTSKPEDERPLAHPKWPFESKEDTTDCVMLSPENFVRVLSQTEFRTMASASMAEPLDLDADGRSYSAAVRAFAIDDPGELSPNRPVYPKMPTTRRARIATLPSWQPRPTGPRNEAIATATVLTPFTLIADVFVDPIAFVGWLFSSNRC